MRDRRTRIVATRRSRAPEHGRSDVRRRRPDPHEWVDVESPDFLRLWIGLLVGLAVSLPLWALVGFLVYWFVLR